MAPSVEQPQHVDYRVLYKKPFSTLLTSALCSTFFCNATMLALAGVALGSILLDGGQLNMGTAANVFFWLTVPSVMAVNSYVDLHKHLKLTLHPQRILISAVVGLTLWGLITGVWMPCSVDQQPASYSYVPVTNGYCPFWAGWSPLSVARILPFLALLPDTIYIFYLVLGAIVVDRHRQVKASLADETNTPEASTSNRYKLASDIYTDVEVASNSLPSTFRCNIASTAPTAQPPSYVTRLPGGTVSPRTSSFLSEMSHWRRDVEMASLSGSSHMCTCHCHHHITPPPGIPEVGEEMRIHAARPQRHSNEF